jgi:hypothetical protein
MGAGRFVCVALPLGLTIGSIVCLLIAMLAGITDKNLSMFEIKTQNLSISSSSLENLVDLATRDVSPIQLLSRDIDINELGGDLLDAAKGAGTAAIDGANITAKDLGLADYYKVSLWGYCSWTGGKRTCTKAKFDWARTELNTSSLENIASDNGLKVKLPKEISSALKTFTIVSKWTQVVYIIAIIAAAVELVFGLFAICSRIGSCCTFIVSSIATTAIMAASILATVQSSVVVGAVKSTARAYNVGGSINTSFLAITWLAVAFSMAAGLFWLFTMCCCAADHKSKKSSSSKGAGKKGFMGFGGKRGSRNGDTEKLIPTGSYQRVGDDHSGYHGQQHGVYNNGHEYGVPMHNVKPQARGGNGAYEPYAHTAV